MYWYSAVCWNCSDMTSIWCPFFKYNFLNENIKPDLILWNHISPPTSIILIIFFNISHKWVKLLHFMTSESDVIKSNDLIKLSLRILGVHPEKSRDPRTLLSRILGIFPEKQAREHLFWSRALYKSRNFSHLWSEQLCIFYNNCENRIPFHHTHVRFSSKKLH